MGGRTAIGVGLLAGVLVGGAVVAGTIVLTPGPVTPTRPPIVLGSPDPSVAPASPSASPSAVPVASGSPSPSPTSLAQALRVGEPAPPLTVAQVGGGQISLAALKGKPVWVSFVATWCPPCREDLPRMNGFAERYADSGLVVLAIDVREDEAAVDAFAKQLKVSFPVGLDSDARAQADWRAYALPVHFWIDSDGVIRDLAQGGVGADVMAAGLAKILPGVTVTP